MTDPTSAESSPRPLGKIVILGILGLGIGAFFYFDLGQYISLEALKANRDDLLAYTNENFVAAVVLYVAIVLHSGRFESESFHVGCASHPDEYLIDHEFVLLTMDIVMQDFFLSARFDGGDP